MKSLSIFLAASAIMFSACTMQKTASTNTNINYDDAYFEPKDLETHPIYSAPDPTLVAERRYNNRNKVNNTGTRSYGQSYRDRMNNFYGYTAPRPRFHMSFGNPYRNNLMMYNMNPYFNYGMGMSSFYSPYSGVFNNMYYGGYNGFYDPNWVYYNQMFFACNPGMSYYGNGFNNSNWGSSGSTNNNSWFNRRNATQTSMGQSDVVRNSKMRYNSSVPVNVNRTQNRSYPSTNTTTTTRQTNRGSDGATNVWRSTRSSGSGSSGVSGGSKSRSSNSSGGGSGRRR